MQKGYNVSESMNKSKNYFNNGFKFIIGCFVAIVVIGIIGWFLDLYYNTLGWIIGSVLVIPLGFLLIHIFGNNDDS